MTKSKTSYVISVEGNAEYAAQTIKIFAELLGADNVEVVHDGLTYASILRPTNWFKVRCTKIKENNYGRR